MDSETKRSQSFRISSKRKCATIEYPQAPARSTFLTSQKFSWKLPNDSPRPRSRTCSGCGSHPIWSWTTSRSGLSKSTFFISRLWGRIGKGWGKDWINEWRYSDRAFKNNKLAYLRAFSIEDFSGTFLLFSISVVCFVSEIL